MLTQNLSYCFTVTIFVSYAEIFGHPAKLKWSIIVQNNMLMFYMIHISLNITFTTFVAAANLDTLYLLLQTFKDTL